MVFQNGGRPAFLSKSTLAAKFNYDTHRSRIPAEIPRLARNESTSVIARARVTHSRADKDKPLVVVLKKP
jgi:hypothetical protein